MSKYENFSIGYFLTRALFLGIGFSLIIDNAKQDSILAFIIGTIIGFIFVSLIDQISKYKGEKSLNEILKSMKFLGIILRITFLIFALVLLCEGFTFIQLFASSFFLIRSPIFFISLPILILLIEISKNGITTVSRVASCLFPISFLLTLISLCALFGYANTSNVTPLFVIKPLKFFQSVFFYASLAVSPSLLTLVLKKASTKYSYLLASLTLIAKMFLIIAIVGPILARAYRFPEYVILKEIKLFNFIEKIENIVALSWIFDCFIYLSMASIFIKDLLPKKKNRLIHTLILIGIYFLSFLFIGKYYTHELIFYYFIPIFVTIIYFLTIPILFIHLFKRRKKYS